MANLSMGVSATATISKSHPSVFLLKKKTELHRFIKEAHQGETIPGNVHQRQYRNGRLKPRGIHDYQNLQWDPTVYRGKTWRDFREKNLPPYTTTVDFNKFCCSECQKLDRDDRHKPRFRHNRKSAAARVKVGGIFLPTDSEALVDEYTTKPERRNKFDETYKQMLPFIVEEEVIHEYREAHTQSDETCEDHCDRHKKHGAHSSHHKTQLGPSKGVQAIVGENENDMASIVGDIGTKVISQSLTETVEEMRLRQIRAEINPYMEGRAMREYNKMKITEAELFRSMVTAKEKTILFSQYEDMQDAEEFIGAITFSVNVSTRLFTETLTNLRRENFFAIESKDIEDKFNRWIHMEKAFLRTLSPFNLLDDIILNAINLRGNSEEVPPVPVPANSHGTWDDPEDALEKGVASDDDLQSVYFNARDFDRPSFAEELNKRKSKNRLPS